jgi:hypothetical protein
VRRADHSFRGVLPCVCLIVCDLETSTIRRPRPDFGCCATKCTYFSILATRTAHYDLPYSSVLTILVSMQFTKLLMMEYPEVLTLFLGYNVSLSVLFSDP